MFISTKLSHSCVQANSRKKKKVAAGKTEIPPEFSSVVNKPGRRKGRFNDAKTEGWPRVV